jgi:lipoprotein NlpI
MLWVAITGVVDGASESSADLVSRGMRHFRDNQIAESLRDFDRAVELDPQTAPYLWQRGISDYYAGKFREGRRQFEIHKTVNPDDVENAAWHFLCVARSDGLTAAKKSLIAIDLTRDPRVPMAQIYEFFGGRGSEAAVLDAAKKAGTERALMYAHLYLGLYFEVAGDAEKARRLIRDAASAHIESDYMHDVARIHLQQRKWNR